MRPGKEVAAVGGPPCRPGAVAAAEVAENPRGVAGGRRVADEARILDEEVERLEGIEEGRVAVVAGYENRFEA